MQSDSYLMQIFALRNEEGEIVLKFPPVFGPDKVIRFFPYGSLMEIARNTGLIPCLVEVKVSFEFTGHIDPIPGSQKSYARSISVHVDSEVRGM